MQSVKQLDLKQILRLKYYQDVQLAFVQYITFYPGQVKSVRETEPNRFCFPQIS